MKNYSNHKLMQASTAIEALIYKCEKSLGKLTNKTSQHTLLSNRIEALKMALDLIEKENNYSEKSVRLSGLNNLQIEYINDECVVALKDNQGYEIVKGWYFS